MYEFQPTRLAEITDGVWHSGEPSGINGFCFDTRKIAPGDCFIALSSEVRDGHDFIKDAIKGGATAAITNRALNIDFPQLVVQDTLLAMGAIASDVRSSFAGPVVGITGSSGKTSTKEMLRLLLGETSTHATSGNWNNRIGVPMTLFDLDPEKHSYAVIEAGINQPGEMALLGEMIQPDLSIITNIGPAHLELLESLEGVAEEKSQLAKHAKAGSPMVLPSGVLEYPAFSSLAQRCIAVRFDSEAESPEAKSVIECQLKRSGCGRFHELFIDAERYSVKTFSQGIAQNAALAIVAARELGVSCEQLAERIQKWQPESTRGRVVVGDGYYYYIDCYNANPASMVDAIQAFERSAPNDLSRCYVLGVMNELGHSAHELHRSVGRQLSLRAQDQVICIGPDELTDAYQEGLTSGTAKPEQVTCAQNVADVESAVADFKGALFLKGSRSYHLERLLPEFLSNL